MKSFAVLCMPLVGPRQSVGAHCIVLRYCCNMLTAIHTVSVSKEKSAQYFVKAVQLWVHLKGLKPRLPVLPMPDQAAHICCTVQVVPHQQHKWQSQVENSCLGMHNAIHVDVQTNSHPNEPCPVQQKGHAQLTPPNMNKQTIMLVWQTPINVFVQELPSF